MFLNLRRALSIYISNTTICLLIGMPARQIFEPGLTAFLPAMDWLMSLSWMENYPAQKCDGNTMILSDNDYVTRASLPSPQD